MTRLCDQRTDDDSREVVNLTAVIETMVAVGGDQRRGRCPEQAPRIVRSRTVPQPWHRGLEAAHGSGDRAETDATRLQVPLQPPTTEPEEASVGWSLARFRRPRSTRAPVTRGTPHQSDLGATSGVYLIEGNIHVLSCRVVSSGDVSSTLHHWLMLIA